MDSSFILKSLRSKRVLSYTGVFLLMLLTMWMGVCFGSVMLPVKEVVMILGQVGLGLPLEASFDTADVQIVINVRLPRVVLAFLVGAALALAGAAFQGLLQNPLADPYTLGVSSGAALGSVLFILFGGALASVWVAPLVSIVAALVTLFLVLFLARCMKSSLTMETVILIGVIVSAFLSAHLTLLMALSHGELKQVVYWLMGSVGMRGWSHVGLILPFFLIGTMMLWCSRHALNAFMYGERTAQYVGVAIKKHKYNMFIAATMLAGSAVAVAGTIGFVGLVIPHIVRTLVGSDYRHVLSMSLMLGGTFLVLADFIARMVVMPSELPLGVVTAMIGAPLFALLLYRHHKRKKEGAHSC